jgi:hypothetical protein
MSCQERPSAFTADLLHRPQDYRSSRLVQMVHRMSHVFSRMRPAEDLPLIPCVPAHCGSDQRNPKTAHAGVPHSR